MFDSYAYLCSTGPGVLCLLLLAGLLQPFTLHHAAVPCAVLVGTVLKRHMP